MKSIYNTPGFSEELLLVCASLREVGLDNLADQFRDAVFDRSVVDQAIIALRERVKTPSPEHAADNIAAWPFSLLPSDRFIFSE
ncbi:TPA: hypothetical protein ACXID6_002483 [Pseudomonas aeruginosa]